MNDELRPISIERNYTRYAPGSVLVKAGETRVICTAMIEDVVPRHCLGQQRGWISAEYTMLPGANPNRTSLQKAPSGRSREIQRLIGRTLRAAVDLFQIGTRTIWIDCTVLQGDGGTRTAAITGGFVALVDALNGLKEKGKLESVPLKNGIAAVSVGVVDGEAMLDLTAEEDQRASVDMNVVMTHGGEFIEIQGTSEKAPFDHGQLNAMIALARKGLEEVAAVQVKALAGSLPT